MPGKKTKTAVLLSSALILILFLVQKRTALSQILTVTICSICFCALLSPLCSKLEQIGCSSSLASLASVLVLSLSFLIIASVFLPYLASKTLGLFRQITPTLLSGVSMLSTRLDQSGLQLQSTAKLTELLTTALSSVSMRVSQTGVVLARQLGSIAFSIVISYYLLRERKKLVSYFLLFFPLDMRGPIQSAVLGCKNALLGYLSGILKTSAFVSLSAWILLSFLRVQDAFLLALFMGVFEILPYIGPLLSTIPLLLVTLPGGVPYALVCLAIVLLIQQIEGNIVSPYFTASSTSIHPLLALVSVFIGGMLFGLGGILLAIPFTIIARSLYWSLLKTRIVMKL